MGLCSKGATVKATAEEGPEKLTGQEQKDGSRFGATSPGSPSLASLAEISFLSAPAPASITVGTGLTVVYCPLSLLACKKLSFKGRSSLMGEEMNE